MIDAPVSEQPDVGAQPAPLPMSVEGESISPQVPPEVVQLTSTLTPTQLKALAIVLEASPNRDEMRAVGHVLNNRARNPARYGESLNEMLMGGEFDGFKTTPEKINEMLASDRFREAEQIDALDALAASEVLRAALEVNLDDELKKCWAGIAAVVAGLMPGSKRSTTTSPSVPSTPTSSMPATPPTT